MAEILPFRAWRYNPETAGGLDLLLTQPYDKITEAMQRRYLDLSPYNLAHVIRGRAQADDSARSNVYTRAAAWLEDWRENRALVGEGAPAIFPYEQEYTLPGGSERRTRRGFIALLRLEDYAAQVVFRHEQTLAGPKADRLELLKATRLHAGQIFMLYSDSEGAVEAPLARRVTEAPWQSLEDEFGTRHTVWRESDPAVLAQVVEQMRARPLVIADGHHRYETALAYRDLCRARGAADARAEYVMVTLVRKESRGLTVLPTHRVVHGLQEFDWRRLLAQAGRRFEIEEVAQQTAGNGFPARLREAGKERPAFGVYAGPGRLALLRLRGTPREALPALPESLARLDAVVLHRLLLEEALCIDARAVSEERNLVYRREAAEAAAEVESGRAQAAFFLNPTPVDEVWKNALAGHALPQKSTDFYPKLLSGLALYWLDNPAGL